MKTALTLLLLLNTTFMLTLSAMTPELEKEYAALHKKSLELRTELMREYQSNLELHLAGLQRTQTIASRASQEFDPQLPEVPQSLIGPDIEAYGKAIQGVEKALKDLALYEANAKSSILEGHKDVYRKYLEQKKYPILPEENHYYDHLTPCSGGDEIV